MPFRERWGREWGPGDAASEVLSLKRFANREEEVRPSCIPVLGKRGKTAESMGPGLTEMGKLAKDREHGQKTCPDCPMMELSKVHPAAVCFDFQWEAKVERRRQTIFPASFRVHFKMDCR